MRILLIHNHYGSSTPSGENRVFLQEQRLLTAHGHDVRVIERYNDVALSRGVFGAVSAAMGTPWNPIVASEVKKRVAEFDPHVLHAHNTFPLISPSIFRAARGTARVLTLHNYRIFCAEATTTRRGQPCVECLTKRSSVPALRYGCYRNSRVATVPLAASISLHRHLGTWHREVDAFISLTEFQKNRLVEGGLEGAKVWVKPNFITGVPAVIPWAARGERVVYAGRLSAEKGVEDLVSAWLSWGADAPELMLLGDGPLRAAIEEKIGRARVANIRVMGQVDARSAQAFIGSSKLVVLPSLVTESFGLPLIEGFAQGTPALVSDRGPLQGLAGNGGHVFRAGDVDDLYLQAKELWNSPGRLELMASEGHRRFLDVYSESENYRLLMMIYGHAMEGAGRVDHRE